MVERGDFADAWTMTTAAQTPTPEPPVSKRLTRSSGDRVIAGVAGGFGRYLGVDPAVVRIALVVLIFFGGAGVLIYGAAWLLVPSDDKEAGPYQASDIARRIGIVLGVLVLVVAAAMGGFWGSALGGGTATAIVVVAVGLLLVAG